MKATEVRTSFEKLFRDPCAESAKTLSHSHPSFLNETLAKNLLIRRAPASLREAIARDLVENASLHEFSTKYRLAALLISRGIRDKETIEELSFDGALTFKEFEAKQAKFERMISSAKTHFFTEHKFVDSGISQKVWERFDAAWNTLSVKQKSALEIHIMSEDPMSLEQGAKRLKISKAAFRERVQSGMKKVEKALPELILLRPTKSATPAPAKAKPKKITLRKIAPDQTTLNEWIERSTHEPQWADWSIIFERPQRRKSIGI